MSNTKTAKTVAEKLKAAKRAEDRMLIHLPGPQRAEWIRLNEELEQLVNRSVGMLVPDPKQKTLARKIATLETEMRDAGIEVTLRALARQRTPATPEDEVVWKELLKEHEPRKGKDGKPVPEDANVGYNWDTFPEALIRASVVDPVMTDEEWNGLLYEVMTDAQFDRLFEKCWRLNRNLVDVPFSSVASKILTRDTRSRRQNGSGSPADGSKAGSQPK
jgi:hypothetical protein